MGYWGTIVVAKSDRLLAEQEGIAGFGYKHDWLRELSDGWQLLETGGFDGPPDLVGAAEALVAATGHPVWSAYVSNSDCAAMSAAVPGRTGPLTHLWRVEQACGSYRHQPRGMAEPAGRGVDEVVAELTAWSAAAGLRADTAGLRTIVNRDRDADYADDLVFALVRALGITRIGRTRPWSLPAYDWPFSSVMHSLGPAMEAHRKAMHRAEDGQEAEPAQPWEVEALALEAELWASLYRPGVDVAALARRAVKVDAAYDDDSVRRWGVAIHDDPAERDRSDAERLAELDAWLASGTALASSEEREARAQADSRASDG